MSRLDKLKQRVKDLYAEKNTDRAEWADWLGEYHVPVVAENADRLAKRFGANPELSQVAGLLHDIADAIMSRFNTNHTTESLRIARELMTDCDYNNDEISLVVDDAMRWHSCRDDNIPRSIEGKVMATADALAHLQTDYYIFATWIKGRSESLEQAKSFVLRKIEQDFHQKILFDEVSKEVETDYLMLKTFFSRD